MKVNWFRIISVSLLLSTLMSCGKDENDKNDERLSEASFYNHSQNCITTSFLRYENERLTGYTSLHFDYDANDTADVQNTEIEYNGDSVTLSTYRTWHKPEILYKIVRHYEAGNLVRDIIYHYNSGSITYSKEVSYEWIDIKLIRKLKDSKIDSVFYAPDNRLVEIKSYATSGENNIIQKKQSFKFEGNRIIELSDSLFLHYQGKYTSAGKATYHYSPEGLLQIYNGETFEYNSSGNLNKISNYNAANANYVSYKYEHGKGNAVQIFIDPYEQLIGLPHDPGSILFSR